MDWNTPRYEPGLGACLEPLVAMANNTQVLAREHYTFDTLGRHVSFTWSKGLPIWLVVQCLIPSDPVCVLRHICIIIIIVVVLCS